LLVTPPFRSLSPFRYWELEALLQEVEASKGSPHDQLRLPTKLSSFKDKFVKLLEYDVSTWAPRGLYETPDAKATYSLNV
jgi:hypothetical protein